MARSITSVMNYKLFFTKCLYICIFIYIIPRNIIEFVHTNFKHKHSEYFLINKSMFTQNSFQQNPSVY